MVFPYPMDPYNVPIPYQWPALLSSPPALCPTLFVLTCMAVLARALNKGSPLASLWLENTKNNLNMMMNEPERF